MLQHRLRRLVPRSIGGILLLVLLVVLVPLLLLQVATYYFRFQDARARALQDNLELARSVAADFQAQVEGVLHQELAIGKALTEPQTPPVEQINRYLADSAGEFPIIRSYRWVSPRGLVIAASDPGDIGTDLSDRLSVQDVEQGREWAVIDLFQSAPDGNPAFIIARGIRDAGGKLQGIVVAQILPERLGSVLRVERAGQASIVVFDTQGQLVYRYPEVALSWEQRQQVAKEPSIRQALAGRDVVSNGFHVASGQVRVGGFVPIAPIGWVAGATVPEEEIVDPLLQDAGLGLGVFLLVSLVALVLALLAGHYLTAPITRLKQGASVLARGELSHQVAATGPKEVIDLANAFNRMAADLRLREQQREDYVHMISHDLRNPLSVIKGQAQLLEQALQKASVNGLPQRSAGAILTSSDRMNALIQDMVDAARMESGQLKIEARPLDLRALILDLQERSSAVGGTERVRVALPEDLALVLADPDRLERVLNNLLSNALKYSAPDTPVTVSATQLDGEVVVAVSDQGPGISPAALPHLFDRFYRTGDAREKKEGLGLGLYITKGLVEAHHGRLWVESEAGKGSTFYVSLPLA